MWFKSFPKLKPLLTDSDYENKDTQDFQVIEEAEIVSVYISIHRWPNFNV